MPRLATAWRWLQDHSWSLATVSFFAAGFILADAYFSNPALPFQLLTVAAVLAVPFSMWRSVPSVWAWAGAVMCVVSPALANAYHVAFLLLEPPRALGLAIRLYQLHSLVLTATYAGLALCAMAAGRHMDLQARLIWVVLVTAETVSIAEYAQCKLFADPFGSKDPLLSQIWGIEVSTFACARVYGYISPYVIPLVTAIYVLFVIGAQRHGSRTR